MLELRVTDETASLTMSRAVSEGVTCDRFAVDDAHFLDRRRDLSLFEGDGGVPVECVTGLGESMSVLVPFTREEAQAAKLCQSERVWSDGTTFECQALSGGRFVLTVYYREE